MTEANEWNYFKFKILWNLVSSKKWGANYARIVHVTSGLPGDKIGTCREVLDELVKEGLLFHHKKRKAVSLNYHRKRDIMSFLESFNE